MSSLLALGAAACGSQTQVLGPFTSALLEGDLTHPMQPQGSIDSHYDDLYVQVILADAHQAETVTASMTPGGAYRDFTVPKDGDLGMLFHFYNQNWAPGMYEVAVTRSSSPDPVGKITVVVR